MSTLKEFSRARSQDLADQVAPFLEKEIAEEEHFHQDLDDAGRVLLLVPCELRRYIREDSVELALLPLPQS
jgi:hypothetical protein